VAVTNRTLWLLRALRVDVGEHADDTVRRLTAAWVQAWDMIDAEWRAAIADVVAVYAAGERWPAPWQLARIDRLVAAQQQTAAALAALTATTNTTVGAAAVEVVAATAAAEPAIMASQLPAALASAALKTYAARIVPSALESIASRARTQIHAGTWPLTEDAVQAMRRALIAGVATGTHPNDTARQMVDQVEGAFNGGLTRAINIARTEILDAYRHTSGAVHAANADVLDGWTWVATLDARTCPSCWAMHGTHHPLDQPGPWDHQQGRCARIPKVKSWAELGIPGVEGEDLTPDAEKVFAALPPDQQLAIMGPGRLALLTAGRIEWSDLATRRDTQAWRPSYVPRTVRELQAIADRRAVA
jgi:SPP1 gp7 family putative phage head morphogenesis protein